MRLSGFSVIGVPGELFAGVEEKATMYIFANIAETLILL
jgi:hypothetical protein